MPAGYSITDGQVTPSSDVERMDANVAQVKALDPDIICLYEVVDIYDAEYLSSKFSDYPFIIPVSGVRAIGPSSMMYIASKYEIDRDSIEFIPFIKGTELTGRAKNSEKGFLSFDIKSKGEKVPFASLVSTHLQHSEIPAQPEESDVKSRALQMEKIAKHIETKIAQDRAVIFTGDLNQEEAELNTFLDQHQITWQRDPSVKGTVTWGGDKWCSELMGKPISDSLVLDYTFIAGKVTAISTRIMGTGYYGAAFSPKAGSDHDLLFSTITVR
jgi:endonuclease/exonuclease/phosphatase family metal-dependent hydrolase